MKIRRKDFYSRKHDPEFLLNRVALGRSGEFDPQWSWWYDLLADPEPGVEVVSPDRLPGAGYVPGPL
jgi:hypothetical protein